MNSPKKSSGPNIMSSMTFWALHGADITHLAHLLFPGKTAFLPRTQQYCSPAPIALLLSYNTHPNTLGLIV